MARNKYPFTLSNDLDKYIRLKQSQATLESGVPHTMNDIYKDMAEFMGVSENTIALIKSNNYNPSLVVAMAMAEYFGTTVDNIFTLECREV